MTIPIRRVFFCIVFIVIFTQAYATVDSGSTKSYSIPMGELKYILINWLEKDGLDVTDETPQPGKMDLLFRHNGQPWKIELVPESALATQVTFIGSKNDPDSLKFEEELWTFINAYIGPNQKNTPTVASDPLIPKVIYSKIGSAVCINTSTNGMSSQFSGFVIDSNGTIICTAHDLKKYKIIKITDLDGKAYLGKVVKLDAAKDLALIQSQLKLRNFISLANGREDLNKEERIYATGCPMNKLGKITIGRVTKPPVKANQLLYWQVSMRTSPGSSGSAVFDERGVLIGMVKGRFRGTNTIGFLIPIDRIRAFINE
jgi:serine protease Do